MKKYIAELIGTFALSLVVLLAVSATAVPLAISVIAGLTLGLFVYTIGPISGCNINPAVTIALLSIRKISPRDAIMYIIAQLLGALLAIIVAKGLGIVSPITPEVFDGAVFFAEMLGTFFFAFGIAAVVYGKVRELLSGFVIGGSLLFGTLVASLAGSAGILNPAVALSLNSLTAVYLFAPVLGAILGMQAYTYLIGGE